MFSGKTLNHQQHNQQLPQNPNKSGSIYLKRNKKFNKIKRSVEKSESNKSPTNSAIDPQLSPSSISKATIYNKIPKTYKTLKPTKIKSCGRKISEKQISALNALANKKNKSVCKKSPTYIKFANSALLFNEKTSFIKSNEQTSVCRPGTLYSDVLFGAGSSCLVKVKNLAPRRCYTSAQEKLTKALFKYTDNNVSDECEIEIKKKRKLIPSLQKINNNKICSSTPPTTSTTCSESIDKTSPTSETISNLETLTVGSSKKAALSPNKCDFYEEADVVIQSEHNDLLPSLKNNNSNGNYWYQHFQLSNDNANDNAASSQNSIKTNTHSTSYSMRSSCSSAKSFIDDIPQWNFINTNTSLDNFPQFLAQFDDEHYLNAEQMALLSFKLALGNTLQYNNFKFS